MENRRNLSCIFQLLDNVFSVYTLCIVAEMQKKKVCLWLRDKAVCHFMYRL